YYEPLRDPLVFHRFPGCSSYTASLLRRFRDGTRRVSPVASRVLAIVLSLLPRQSGSPLQSGATIHAAFALRLQARPLGPLTFEATSAFTFVTAQWLAITPRMMPSIGFRNSVSFLPSIPATSLLTL